MEYRTLGRTGRKVSALSFGCMRLPKVEEDPKKVDVDASVALFQRAKELGVNYFDTAYMYDNGDSERTLGTFLEGIDRDEVIVATKNPVGHQFWPIPGDQPVAPLWRRCLEEELERLGTDHIDVLFFHDTTLVTFRILACSQGGSLQEALRAKEEGLIRHIGISSHDTPQNVIRLIEMAKDEIDVAILQYNLLDRRYAPVIDFCGRNKIGVATMGSIGGGRLIHPSAYTEAVGTDSTPEVALRFVLANPSVSTAMSGMNSMEQLEENARTASRKEPLSAEEMERIEGIERENRELLDLYCTGCAYCMPCPHGVDIPGNFRAMNTLKVHGIEALAHRIYDRLGDGQASHCVACGECAGKCPQQIDIQARLTEVAQVFSA